MTDRAESDFSELLRRAKGGDMAAVGVLYEQYGNVVARRVRDYLGPGLRRANDTSDIVHDVFLSVMKYLASFDVMGPEKFKHWLLTITERILISKGRKLAGPGGQRRSVTLGTGGGGHVRTFDVGPATRAADAELRERVFTRMRLLPPEQQSLLSLRIVHGHRYQVIADRLGLPSADAARKRIVRALTELRKPWAGT